MGKGDYVRKLSKVLLIGSFILTLGACGNQTETITKITLQVQAVYRHTDDFGSIYTLDQKGNIELEKYSSF